MKKRAHILVLTCLLFAKQAPASQCMKVGLLGEFTRPTGSTRQPFGQEILRGIELGKLYSKDSSVCVDVSAIDIENSIANIPGHIERAAKNGINVFIGLGISEQALLAKESLDRTRSVLLTPTASSNQLTIKSNRTILLFPKSSEIANKLAMESKKRGYKKVIAVYASNNIYSSEFLSEFSKHFADHKHSLISIGVRAGAATADDLIEQILKNQDYDAIFLPLFEIDVARILAGLARSHMQTREVIGADSWGTYAEVVSHLANIRYMKGIQPEIYSPTFENKVNQVFVKIYQGQYRGLPTDLAAFSFDALRLAKRMAELCGVDATKWSVNSCAKSALPLDSTTGLISKIDNGALKRDVNIKAINIQREERL